MGDLLIEGVLRDAEVSYVYAQVEEVANQAVLRHNCDPVAAHVLSRATVAGLLCSRMLGEGERLNLRWQYAGALKTVIVDAGNDGTIRSLVSPAQLGEEIENKAELYGEHGDINVIRLKGGVILNSGTTESVFMDEADDLAFYYCSSEQVETSMLVMVGFTSDPQRPVRLCHGLLLQALPDCDLMHFQDIRERLDGLEFRELMKQRVEDASTLPGLLAHLRDQPEQPLSHTLHEGPSPRFACTCNQQKMTGVIQMIEVGERQDILDEGKALQVRCQFCNALYEIELDTCRTAWGML